MPLDLQKYLERTEITCDAPNLGQVKIRAVPIRSTDAASTYAREQGKPFADNFTFHLLSSMIWSPEMTVEEVSKLTKDDLTAIIECAVEQLDYRKQYEATDKERPITERFHRAHLQYHEDSYKNIAKTMMPKITDIMGSIYSGSISDAMSVFLSQSNELHNLTSGYGSMLDMQRRLVSPTISEAISSVPGLFDTTKINTRIPMGINLDYIKSLSSDIAEQFIPEPFFSDALTASGLNSPTLYPPSYLLPPIQVMETQKDIDRRADEAERQRLLEAFAVLFELERGLRRLIAIKLEEAAGLKWWKQRVSGALQAECEVTRQKQGARGAKSHPIDYSYVGNLKDIIVQKNI